MKGSMNHNPVHGHAVPTKEPEQTPLTSSSGESEAARLREARLKELAEILVATLQKEVRDAGGAKGH